MADINEWSDLFPHTITHKPFSSRDDYGAPTYSSSTDYSARVNYKPRLVRSADGEQVVSKGRVWIMGTPTVGPEDQIVLPDGSTPAILSVSRISDENGTHHVVVDFG